jgi:hypothetical protein
LAQTATRRIILWGCLFTQWTSARSVQGLRVRRQLSPAARRSEHLSTPLSRRDVQRCGMHVITLSWSLQFFYLAHCWRHDVLCGCQVVVRGPVLSRTRGGLCCSDEDAGRGCSSFDCKCVPNSL